MSAFRDTAPSTTKHLLLLGAGPAHVELLKALATKPLPGLHCTLLAPSPNLVHAPMVPGLVAGHHPLSACSLDLRPLLQRANVTWLQHSARAVRATSRQLLLDDGGERHWDWLSIDNPLMPDREQMEKLLPGARQFGMFLRPTEAFCALWPRLQELAAKRALRLAVIGANVHAIELALALRQGLRGCAVSLLAGAQPPAHGQPQALRERLLAALRRHGIAVLPDSAVALRETEVELASGARLACDVPVIAFGAQPPAWLADSDLRLDPQGYIGVDSCQGALGHANVFAVGEAAARTKPVAAPAGQTAAAAGPHSMHAASAGRALARTLRALAAGKPASAYRPPRQPLTLLYSGNGRAIGHRGSWNEESRWVWQWKSWMDRRWMASVRGTG